MITQSPYGLGHIIKPGRLPEPMDPVHTCDPQSAIDRCLDCEKDKCCGTCKPEDSAKYTGERRDVKRRKLRDEKILAMISEGRMSDKEICDQLGIGKSTFYNAKKRLRERGALA